MTCALISRLVKVCAYLYFEEVISLVRLDCSKMLSYRGIPFSRDLSRSQRIKLNHHNANAHYSRHQIFLRLQKLSDNGSFCDLCDDGIR